MKKLALAAAAAFIAVALTGCSSDKGANSGSSQGQSSAASTAESSTPSAASTAEASVPSAASTAETGSQTVEQSDGETGALSDIYDKVMALQPDTNDLIMFPESSEDMINGLYPGLSDLDITEMALYAPPVTGNACEILLVKAADSDNADKAEKIIQTRVDNAASDTVYPDVADVWKRNASVQRSGNIVCMIVLPDGAVIPDDVFSL